MRFPRHGPPSVVGVRLQVSTDRGGARHLDLASAFRIDVAVDGDTASYQRGADSDGDVAVNRCALQGAGGAGGHVDLVDGHASDGSVTTPGGDSVLP
jgi:hypothetical protein